MKRLTCFFRTKKEDKSWRDRVNTIDGKEYGVSGTIDGIPYRPINEALAGPNGDGNGCISGYNCRHRAIEYEKGSRPPEDFSQAEMEREYAVDKQQRAYENRIRQLKQEEKQLRACGMEKEAAEKRKQWRRLTKDYQIYSIEHDRAYYPYRYVIDRSEEELDDGKIYVEWKKTIGEENMPKTLAEFVEIKYNKDRQQEFEKLRQIRAQEIDYKVAEAGGAHSGKLADYQKNFSIAALEKTVKNLDEKIALHISKINNPEQHDPDWSKRNLLQQEGSIKHWRKEILNFQKQKNIALAELRRRRDE